MAFSGLSFLLPNLLPIRAIDADNQSWEPAVPPATCETDIYPKWGYPPYLRFLARSWIAPSQHQAVAHTALTNRQRISLLALGFDSGSGSGFGLGSRSSGGRTP